MFLRRPGTPMPRDLTLTLRAMVWISLFSSNIDLLDKIFTPFKSKSNAQAALGRQSGQLYNKSFNVTVDIVLVIK